MNITRHNCESFFLDYYEKTLSPVEVAEVLFFLEENPDLKEVFESFKAIFIEQERINFPDKEALKKKYSAEELGAILSSDITRLNCEQFFIASAEGVLSSSQKEKLHLFLLQYPELKKEAALFEQCRLSAEAIVFESKESLKKELITKANREEYFIRSVENDLNASEQKALNLFLAKHTEYKKELELFAKAVIPAEAISFEDKPSLKKKEKRTVFVSIFSHRQTYYAAAAAILLLLGLFFIFRNNEMEQTFVADKIVPARLPDGRVTIGSPNKTLVNVKKENVVIPVKQNEQEPIASIHYGSNRRQGVSLKKKTAATAIPDVKREEKEFQPIIFEDKEELIAEKELQKPELMTDNLSAEKKQDEKNPEVNPDQAIASVTATRSNDGYQTMGAVVRKKIRSALGIKKATECESASDKIGIWDLAMAAKNGVQKVLGTKAIDVTKVCDGTGKKVEYVFAAGNFGISRSASK